MAGQFYLSVWRGAECVMLLHLMSRYVAMAVIKGNHVRTVS